VNLRHGRRIFQIIFTCDSGGGGGGGGGDG
jgi:hypothetical protein